MMVSISNAVFESWAFISILVVLFLFSCRSCKDSEFSVNVTQELKGFAILLIVFSHIGFFLFVDHRFLFPLTILAGVGVDLFLFLSGFGLTISSFKKKESILNFYKKRIIKLFIPFWIAFVSFVLMDYLILGITYSKTTLVQSFFGIFLHSDIYQNLNSSFWYLTLILIFYILFPLVFSKKRPWLSALIIYFIVYYFVNLDLVTFDNVIQLYKVHIMAFPLGMIFAWIVTRPNRKIKELYKRFENFVYPIASILLLFTIGYLAIHSGVGKSVKIEQIISILTMLLIIIFFLIKKFEFKILSLFGLYSYEIYLIHWPIMYRYDIFYKYFSAWVATFFYLILFVGLSWIIQKISSRAQKIFFGV